MTATTTVPSEGVHVNRGIYNRHEMAKLKRLVKVVAPESEVSTSVDGFIMDAKRSFVYVCFSRWSDTYLANEKDRTGTYLPDDGTNGMEPPKEGFEN